jgi:hypothetical protein
MFAVVQRIEIPTNILLKWKPTRSEDKECLVRPRVQLPDGHLVTGLDGNVQSEDATFCFVSMVSGEKGYVYEKVGKSGKIVGTKKYIMCINAISCSTSKCSAVTRRDGFRTIRSTRAKFATRPMQTIAAASALKGRGRSSSTGPPYKTSNRLDSSPNIASHSLFVFLHGLLDTVRTC